MLANNDFATGIMRDRKYTCGSDPRVVHFDDSAALLSSSSAPRGNRGTSYYLIPTAPFLGKRLRFSAFLKCENLTNAGGIQIYVGDAAGNELKYAGGANRAVQSNQVDAMTGTSDWRQLEEITDVPSDAAQIVLGETLRGSGRLWLDDPRVEIVGNDVPATDDEADHFTASTPSLTRTNSSRGTAQRKADILCLGDYNSAQ